MVARFNFKCGYCGNTSFTATGFANDMPSGKSQSEWKFRLIFTCVNCTEEVTEIVQRIDGETNLDMKFSR
jgi:hypothetical protein